MLVFLAATAGFAAITAAMLLGDTLDVLDVVASTWLHAHPLSLFTQAMIAVSFLGAPSTLMPVSLL
ncbi:MAG: hypothetical protein E6H74_08960, partial [Betaproteobacteria bacterium]